VRRAFPRSVVAAIDASKILGVRAGFRSGAVRIFRVVTAVEVDVEVLNDVPFEAAFLRAGLLVGLVHEREIPGWALLLIGRSSDLTPRLADIVGARIELSAMREALRPLARSVDAHRVSAALLTAMAVDRPITPRRASDLLRILGQIAQDCGLPRVAAARIKEFQDRSRLASVGMQGHIAPDADELAAMLDEIREPGFFRFHFDDVEEPAVFVAAVSRAVVRERRWGAWRDTVPQAWLLRDPPRAAIVLNEPAMAIVLREFAPVPLVSRIPYRESGDGSVLVMDESTAVPLGAEDAEWKLSV
jgi:hypothetical protein